MDSEPKRELEIGIDSEMSFSALINNLPFAYPSNSIDKQFVVRISIIRGIFEKKHKIKILVCLGNNYAFHNEEL